MNRRLQAHEVGFGGYRFETDTGHLFSGSGSRLIRRLPRDTTSYFPTDMDVVAKPTDAITTFLPI